MPDRERVIKGLLIERECVSRDCDRDCGKCDLVQDRDWLLSVYDDALELLKEQKQVKPNGTRKAMSFAFNGMLTGYCPRCKTIVNSVGNSGACGKCGQKLDWE